MKIAGIIAEYNPFHNGHAYQIDEVKKRTGADYVIAAMGGDFMQRGAPAIMDKYARTRMALLAGIDLVVELPALWAAASAEYFAAAGTALFDKMGCIDFLCFGAETDNLTLLSAVSKILAKKPAFYEQAVRTYVKVGQAFPLAREAALKDYFKEHASQITGSILTNDMLHDLLSSPNNILALEYVKALYLRNSSITPFVIKRKGAGYHDEALTPKNASASAIRKLLLSGGDAPFSACTEDRTEPAGKSFSSPVLHHILPDASRLVTEEYQAFAPFLSSDDLSPILGFQLLCQDKESLAGIADCNINIANRLKKNLSSFRSFSQFCEQNKSRDITYTRMSRVFTHILLSHTKDDYMRFLERDYVPYLRILGFRKEAAPLLRILKRSAEIPLISKLADAKKMLSYDAADLLEKDIFAADLYEQVKFQKYCSCRLYGKNVYTSECLPEKTAADSFYEKSVYADGHMPKKMANEYSREIVRLP